MVIEWGVCINPLRELYHAACEKKYMDDRRLDDGA